MMMMMAAAATVTDQHLSAHKLCVDLRERTSSAKEIKNETIAAELSHFHTALQAQEIKRIHITESWQLQMKANDPFSNNKVYFFFMSATHNKHNLNARHRYKNDLKRKHN